MEWLKNWFQTKNKERNDKENILNNHAMPTVQVDTRTQDIVKRTNKAVKKELKQQHKFAEIAHAPDCHVLHPTDARLDCRKPDCWKFMPDAIVSKPYSVEGRENNSHPINAVKEIDARLYDEEALPEK